ncbi:MAG: sensor histidine kinase [Lachnospiraceae bacterium]|jgi:two-component system sensor histidine kinase YesM|nr:sensor histidine kinase [Lachnospiraceae bacterium]
MKHKSFFSNCPFLRSLKSKLLCTYFLLVVLPLGFFTLYTYLRVRNVIQEQTFTAMQNAFDNTVNSMQQSLDKLDTTIDILALDSLVYAMASNDPDDFTYIRRLEDSNQLTLTFEHLCSLSDIKRIRLYVNNNYLYATGQNNIIQLREVSDAGWYDALFEQNERMWFAPADFHDQPLQEQPYFSSMQVIYNPRNVNEPLAVLRADADASQMISMVENTSVTKNGILLLLKDKEILYHSAGNTPSDTLCAIVEELPSPDENGWVPIQAAGKHYYAQCSPLSKSGWYMAGILPFNDIFHLSHELRFEMLLAVVLISIIAYLLAIAISRSTLNRITLLTQTMQTVQEGNVDVRPVPSGNDEIAQLMGNFNLMMDRIDRLMDEKVMYGQQIKNLELKALQAQINPHFLYNSLDLINCTAISHSVPQISRMVKALGQFYRLSLSGGNEQIPLAGEMKHARLYVDIQNMRFEDSIQAHWSLDEDAGRCLIIKIILQPLIENAILHGIFEKDSKRGNLWVSARRNADVITITIEDDGVGMNEEELYAAFFSAERKSLSETSGGYGVRNICDRLLIAYGEPYGLSCESTPGRGTTVTISIPAIEPE